MATYGATDGGDADDFFKPDADEEVEAGGEEDIGLMESSGDGVAKSTQGRESTFVKYWNMIPQAFPFFSTIYFVFQCYTIMNCADDIDTVVGDLRDSHVSHVDVVNEFQEYQMKAFYVAVVVNGMVLIALYLTMGTGMQRFCNFCDDFEEYHNFQGLTHWAIFVIERTLELLVLFDYLLIVLTVFIYLVWVVGYFMTSVFDGTCDYTDATEDLLSILASDVSGKFNGVDDDILCEHIRDINLDTATVMTDCIFVACLQVFFMLIVVELHKKSQHIMHEHMYDDEELDVITGVIQAKTTMVEEEADEDEEEEDDEPPKAPAVVEDEPEPAPAVEQTPAEEEDPEADQEEFVEEEEIM